MAVLHPAKPRLVRTGRVRVIEINHAYRPVEAFRRERLKGRARDHGYGELCVTSNFTFLRGASHPEELIMRAAELGLASIAITDRNSLAGVVRAYSALKELRRETKGETAGALHLPKLIVGCRLVLRDSPVNWIALPQDRAPACRAF